MAYVYRHFIPQNTAPKGAKNIGVYDGSGKKICTIPLGTLAPPTGTKLYSFGLLSDIHLYPLAAVAWTPETKFDNALSFFESEGCSFCTHCGDMTQTGLYNEGDKTNLAPAQLAKYKEICDKHSIPVYGICGNHESYINPITNNLAELKAYTGTDLYYKVEYQNDVFIFIGQPTGSTPMSDEAFTFLSSTLASNSNKRCFVFIHPVWNDDSGDVNGLYASNGSGGGALLSSWSKGNELKALLAQYPKAILFHGHTHFRFEEQEKDEALNYTNKNGFHSVHIPSLSRLRTVNNGALSDTDSESQGYIVDVYEYCVVLNGIDLVNSKRVPLGTFKINVAEGT